MSQGNPQEKDDADEEHVEVDEEQIRMEPIETDNLSGRSESWNPDEAAYLLDSINQNQRKIAEEINKLSGRVGSQGESRGVTTKAENGKNSSHSIPGTSNPSPAARAVYMALVSAGIALATLGAITSLVAGSVAVAVIFAPVLAFLLYAVYRGMR